MLVDKNTHKKGEITNDDKTILVSTVNSETNQNYIAKIDVNTQKFEFITDKQGNPDSQLDFNLFDSKYNMFVTLVSRNQKNFFL